MATLIDFPLKTNRILNILGLVAIFVVLGFFSCKPPCNTLNAKPYIDPITKDKIPSPAIKIRCNEFVIDPSHSAAEYYRNTLRARGFVLGQTCNCSPAFELWVNPTGEPVDAGTVATNTVLNRPMGTEASGFFPNVIVNLNTPKGSGIAPPDIKDSVICQSQSMDTLMDSIIIAIVDTGVDTLAGSNNLLNDNKWGWDRYHNPTRCISNPSIFGLNILNTQREPSDMLGHGTSVNGVVTGESNPNYYDTCLNIKFLNVNVFRQADTTCTLFDGLCALNYSVHQKANIVNISWGFAFNPENDIQGILKKCIEAAIKKVINAAPNTLFIAALGNDNHFVSHDYRFYPACLADSVSNLMAIGSLNNDINDIAGFSNYADSNIMTFCTHGENIDVACPSYLNNGNNKKLISGTSFAAPLAARVSASIWIRNPELTADQVKSHFVNFLNASDTSTVRGNLPYRALRLPIIRGLICNPPEITPSSSH